MYTWHRLALFCAVTALLLPGCLISTQSFNHGKLLNPGERKLSVGVGWKQASRYMYTDTKYSGDYVLHDSLTDENNRNEIIRNDEYIFDSTRYNWTSLVLNYRSGVLRKYPFGKGLEIGYHIESAFRINRRIESITHTQLPIDTTTPLGQRILRYKIDTTYTHELEFFSPPLLEIETRFGFPDITLQKSIFHHNLSLGWIAGQWADNGWFAGYAAGWEYKRFIPYFNARLLITATDLYNDPNVVDSTMFIHHDRKWTARFTGGIAFTLPYNSSFIPEYISPECSVFSPYFSTDQRIGFTASIGICWVLGR